MAKKKEDFGEYEKVPTIKSFINIYKKIKQPSETQYLRPDRKVYPLTLTPPYDETNNRGGHGQKWGRGDFLIEVEEIPYEVDMIGTNMALKWIWVEVDIEEIFRAEILEQRIAFHPLSISFSERWRSNPVTSVTIDYSVLLISW